MVKINILVVDDDRDIKLLLESYLKKLEVDRIHFTETAAETYEFLNLKDKNNEAKIDLIILDIILEDEDGIAICKKIKSSETYQEIPVIMVTAQKASKFLKRAFEAGAFDFIKKPINKIEFMARINSAIKLRKEMKKRIKREEELLKISAKLKAVNKKLEKIALQDGLTGLANRRLFDKTLKDELNRAKRNKNSLALIMADIDNFKVYNDTYGHQQGDECLKKVASVLAKNAKRASDFSARYGGEEFAVILADTDKDGAVKVAENIREDIRELEIEHQNSNTDKYVTLSLGVSCIKVKREITEELVNSFIEKADQALYQAKEKGKNRVVYLDFE
ncbi:GGDEF domain-containing response regulator [Halanaerobium kushneri]|uniref:Stage 0 sporulation protein A homolog n=1 Tax=Halanaerobium kushneri TaxID=56779 RepID=A0A1N6ZRH6_9FIRM|nr:diguanylate cyclase [Halanaerobium kushneri]SIR29439.1 response regulator receiver modulated diguanylate cyclase [Halanaerobium kushneri]